MNTGAPVIDAGPGTEPLEAFPGVIGSPRKHVLGTALTMVSAGVLEIVPERLQSVAQALGETDVRRFAALTVPNAQDALAVVQIAPPQVAHLTDAQPGVGAQEYDYLLGRSR